MPFFSRSDGVPERDLPALRRIMPYLMRGRNESAVYLPAKIDITKTKRWLQAYNRLRPDNVCTTMHLLLFLMRAVFVEFPELDRFVAGRRLWRRTHQTVSLVVKESLDLTAPTFTIKLDFGRHEESLPEMSRRMAESFQQGARLQADAERTASQLLRFPSPIVRLLLWCRDRLDEWNLLPAKLLRDDPLCTTLFVSNLGSLGVPEAFHHLYETGTCSLFAVIGAVRREVAADSDGGTCLCDILPISWTVDDRIVDGFRFAQALRWLQVRLEDPAQFLGPPQDSASGQVTLHTLVSSSPPATSDPSRS